jgi:MFS family permease
MKGAMRMVVERFDRAPSTARRFPAFTNPHFRLYWIGTSLANAADNVEHVIGYWVIWQLTHSPFWLGYAVVAHWLPFTLFSLHAGSMADRFNSRYLIQISQGFYILASLGWGVLYLTGQLQIWHVAILLLFHGFAGLISGPSSQMLIYEMVGQNLLISAISLNSSLRYIAIVLGPAIGGFLMASVGPGAGFLVNILLYLPLSLIMLILPYRGAPARGRKEEGWQAILEGLRAIRQRPMILGLLCVVAMTSLLVGNAFQALMPAFAERLQATSTGYSVLLSANGVGAVLGVLGLGMLGSTRLRPVVVTVGALLWAFLMILFSLSSWFSLALASLCLIGMSSIIFTSMAQSIIQAWAPDHLRGRVVGVYNLAAHGMRAASGLVIGLLASLLGTPQALLLCGAVIAVVILGIAATVRSLWDSDVKDEALAGGETEVAPVGS